MAPQRTVIRLDREVETLGQAVKRLRLKKGWDQGQLSRAIGETQPEVSRIERDCVANISSSLRTRLEDAFGLAAGELSDIISEANRQQASKERIGLLPYDMVAIGPAEPAIEQVLHAVKDADPEELLDFVRRWRAQHEGPPAMKAEEQG